MSAHLMPIFVSSVQQLVSIKFGCACYFYTFWIDHLLMLKLVNLVTNCSVWLCSDPCGRAVQQCEYRFAVWDGPGVSDAGLWRAVVPGLQCCGLVPLTPLIPPQPFSTGHKHTGPVPGKRNHWARPRTRLSVCVGRSDLLCPDCSRVISHEAEPPSLVWSWARMTQQIHPPTPKPPVCWWERARSPQAPRVCLTHAHAHTHRCTYFIVKIKEVELLKSNRLCRSETCAVYPLAQCVSVTTQSCPTDLTSFHHKTSQTGNRQWRGLSGSSTNTLKHPGESDTRLSWTFWHMLCDVEHVFVECCNTRFLFCLVRTVQLDRFFRKDSRLTCLEKVSLTAHYRLQLHPINCI